MKTQLIKHPEGTTSPTTPQLLHPATFDLRPEEEEALRFLLPLSADYPGIDNWFRSKVVPGLRVNERYIHRVERDGKLIGIGIVT